MVLTRLAEKKAISASMAAEAEAAAKADWGALPAELLRSVCELLEGDTLALCAVAGVCPHWRFAALTTALPWSQLRVRKEDVRCHFSFSDAVVACLAARAGAELTVVVLPSSLYLSDDCLASFTPASAPKLKVLRLVGCMDITMQGVVAALTGSRVLESLGMAGTAPLPVTAAEVNAANDDFGSSLLDPLRELLIDYDESNANTLGITNKSNHNESYGLDVDCVCGHVSGSSQALCCGKLFDSTDESLIPCDVCDSVFCAEHEHKQCFKCALKICDGCLKDVVGEYGYHCQRCSKTVCDECACELLSDPGACSLKFTCGICKLQNCFSCSCDRNSDVLWCEGWSPKCLGAVCRNCICNNDNTFENLIFCAQCCLPFCRPCVRHGQAIRATGRFLVNGYSCEEAFCKSCAEKRKKKAAGALQKR